MATQARSAPCLLWPFWALWRFIATLIVFTGRLVGIVLGLALMMTGLLLSATIVGAIIGVPLALFGLLLVVRSLF